MSYRINPRIAASEVERHHAAERRHVADLRERGLLFEIGGVDVDAEQLVLRTFQCDTAWCLRCGEEEGARKYKGSCCTDLQVDLTGDEKARIVELARRAQESGLLRPREPIAHVVTRVLEGEFTEITDDHSEALLHRKSGGCVLSVIEGAGTPAGPRLRCAINSLTARLGLPLEDYKPVPCYLFPLHYTHYSEDRYLLSLLTEETRYWIGQHPLVGKLRCLKKPDPKAPRAYESLRWEIEQCFGVEFYRELKACAEALLRERGESNARGAAEAVAAGG